MILTPPIKDYIWGGTKLREQFGKESDLERLAESWELSCHKDGHSVIAEGEYKGRTLAEYLEENPDAMGKNCERFENFPVLIKLIDAKDNLSVQVHPDNEYALRVEGEYGKTEMWYIVDCDEGASLIFGFKEEISKEEFRRAIEENTLLDKVNTVPVKKGDVFFIEAGTLHAIGKGILIAEIQQNSNTTYRVYDYGRVGADGKPRELHVEKALDVTNLEQKRASDDKKIKVNLSGCEAEVLATCEYFSAVLLEVQGSSAFETDEKSFTHMLVTEGEAEAVFDDTAIKLKKGSSIFVPAGTGMCRINGNASIIITSVN
ncbi:MAG: class I mannose-6-phosphate isomerase [Ruminococcus sp.]|nr:class I mannose-6-phosphate isomerase [Ruminococcus sp.]